MKIKTIKQLKNITGQRIFLRVDFNVPLKDGRIVEDFKIKQSLADINYLIAQGAKVIIATHLGSPEGKIVRDLSVKSIARLLAKLIDQKVKVLDFNKDNGLVSAGRVASKMKNGEVILLENLRFNKGEQENDSVWAENLASLADVYINDAFAVSHRNDASVSAIKKYLPAYAGFLLEKEIQNLNKVLKPKKPSVVLIGGKKIETKIALFDNLLKKADHILVGGALANNFLSAKGFNVGKSLADIESIKIATALLKKSKEKIILPIDVIVTKSLLSHGRTKSKIRVSLVSDIKPDEYVCDIGPQTIGLFTNYLKKAQTICWNGPLGIFEMPSFRHSTVIIARAIASRSSGRAYGLVGGGETIEALNLSKMAEYIDWVSTGGGAMLAYLGEEKMPGLEGIIK